MKKREVKCKECGKIFNHSKKKYCSEECKKKRWRKYYTPKKTINPYFLVRGLR